MLLTTRAVSDEIKVVSSEQMLRSKDRIQRDTGISAIHESISACDKVCMSAIACGEPEAFLEVLRNTGNTVCGRHPIEVIMAAIAEAKKVTGDDAAGQSRFNFTRYERGSDAISVSDSSVSYVSACLS